MKLRKQLSDDEVAVALKNERLRERFELRCSREGMCARIDDIVRDTDCWHVIYEDYLHMWSIRIVQCAVARFTQTVAMLAVW